MSVSVDETDTISTYPIQPFNQSDYSTTEHIDRFDPIVTYLQKQYEIRNNLITHQSNYNDVHNDATMHNNNLFNDINDYDNESICRLTSYIVLYHNHIFIPYNTAIQLNRTLHPQLSSTSIIKWPNYVWYDYTPGNALSIILDTFVVHIKNLNITCINQLYNYINTMVNKKEDGDIDPTLIHINKQIIEIYVECTKRLLNHNLLYKQLFFLDNSITPHLKQQLITIINNKSIQCVLVDQIHLATYIIGYEQIDHFDKLIQSKLKYETVASSDTTPQSDRTLVHYEYYPASYDEYITNTDELDKDKEITVHKVEKSVYYVNQHYLLQLEYFNEFCSVYDYEIQSKLNSYINNQNELSEYLQQYTSDKQLLLDAQQHILYNKNNHLVKVKIYYNNELLLSQYIPNRYCRSIKHGINKQKYAEKNINRIDNMKFTRQKVPSIPYRIVEQQSIRRYEILNNKIDTDKLYQNLSHTNTQQYNNNLISDYSKKWFKYDQISDVEYNYFTQLFSKNNLSQIINYKNIRNSMIDLFQLNPTCHLTLSAVKRAVIGETTELYHIYHFLHEFGLINCFIHKTIQPDNDDMLRQLVDTKPTNLSFKRNKYTQSNELLCGLCYSNVSNNYYQLYQDENYKICDTCYINGLYDSIYISDDFTAVPSDGWTENETMMLLDSLIRYSDDWTAIAETIGTKTVEQCVNKFITLPINDVYAEQPIKLNPSYHSQFVELLNNTNNKTIPFGDTPNQIMSLLAYISANISPAISSAAAHAILSHPNVAVNNDIQTPYGRGRLVERRKIDGICVVQLTYGTVYIHESTLKLDNLIECANLRDKSTIEMLCNVLLKAAATKANDLASEEQRKILRSVAQLVQAQMRKVEIKLTHLDELTAWVNTQKDLLSNAWNTTINERMNLAPININSTQSSPIAQQSNLPIPPRSLIQQSPISLQQVHQPSLHTQNSAHSNLTQQLNYASPQHSNYPPQLGQLHQTAQQYVNHHQQQQQQLVNNRAQYNNHIQTEPPQQQRLF